MNDLRIYRTALDVCDGDTIVEIGYRVHVSDCICYVSNYLRGLIGGEFARYETSPGDTHLLPVARYKLHSIPGEEPLPRGYEGMAAGGNKFAGVTILKS